MGIKKSVFCDSCDVVLDNKGYVILGNVHKVNLSEECEEFIGGGLIGNNLELNLQDNEVVKTYSYYCELCLIDSLQFELDVYSMKIMRNGNF